MVVARFSSQPVSTRSLSLGKDNSSGFMVDSYQTVVCLMRVTLLFTMIMDVIYFIHGSKPEFHVDGPL